MRANDTNYTNKEKVIHPELSYRVTGICFAVQNNEGRFAREKQYCDALEKELVESKIAYERELIVGGTGNTIDFLIDNKIILEAKAKRFITKEDYFQLQRYLQATKMKLGLVVNFRSKYIKPVRVVRIDTDSRHKFE